MNHPVETSAADDCEISRVARTSKSSIVIRLMSRNCGASIAEIMVLTNWQSHSIRAFLTGLRKKGLEVLKEARKDGETSYRLER